jgi:orotidine-5'-phosphate decarboxylase
LKEVAGLLPVYSPGVGAQGGDAERAIRNGANYLIIGRSIVESRQPAKAAREIQNRISSIGK